MIAYPVAALISLGIAGCGMNNESAVQDRYTDTTQPVGYYSNENHRNHGGNARILNGADNDGPVTEILDHTFGLEGQNYRNNRRNLQVRNESVNESNSTSRDAGDTRNFTKNDTLFSRNDKNYHGHLGNNAGNAQSSYYEAYEGELVEKINLAAANVNNVREAQTVVNGNDIIIAASLKDSSREETTKTEIQNAVKPFLNGRTSHIVTDEKIFNRLRNIDNDLRNGGPRDQFYSNIKDLFRTNTNR